MARLHLPEVTLCAAASVNVEATVFALKRCLHQIDFADCLLLTDSVAGLSLDERIRKVSIPRLSSAEAYSHFLLRELGSQVRTSHCLVVQWDGFVLDASCWDPHFLSYDYVGAPWPQFQDGHEVGNGGFSLRSRRLLDACCQPDFQAIHPEDVAIARVNRVLLEGKYGIRFASRTLAERFSFERTRRSGSTFGFHGIFNLVEVLGAEDFWALYRSLDDRSTIRPDFWRLMRQLGRGSKPWQRRARLTADRAGMLISRI